MSKKSLRMEAHAVRIYGAIKQHDGRITVKGLSNLLKIEETTVRKIVRERGWALRDGRGDGLRAWQRFDRVDGDPKELNF